MNGLIIDTNLLIVLLVGTYNPSLINRYCGFDQDTFVFIKRLLALTQPKIVVTPHILTEVHNLTFHAIKQPGLEEYVSKVIGIIELAHEEHIDKTLLLGNVKMLAAFGFTDLSIIEAAKKNGYAVITDDDRLFGSLLSNDCQARNILGLSVFA